MDLDFALGLHAGGEAEGEEFLAFKALSSVDLSQQIARKFSRDYGASVLKLIAGVHLRLEVLVSLQSSFRRQSGEL